MTEKNARIIWGCNRRFGRAEIGCARVLRETPKTIEINGRCRAFGFMSRLRKSEVEFFDSAAQAHQAAMAYYRKVLESNIDSVNQARAMMFGAMHENVDAIETTALTEMEKRDEY